MAAPISLRPDFTADQLRQEARRSRDAGQARRLLALATIYDGGSRSDAARVGDVTLQIVRDWVVRFNAEGPAGLIERKAAGRAPKLNDAQRKALAAMVREGARPGRARRGALAAGRPGAMAVGGVPRLAQRGHGWARTAQARLSQAVGAPASPRPGARQLGDIQKNFPAALAEIGHCVGAGKRIEVWFQDEARVGQKNGITRRWARARQPPRRRRRTSAPPRPICSGQSAPPRARARRWCCHAAPPPR